MADKKVVFLAFAVEDESTKNLFLGQRLLTDSPFEWTDMAVKEPYESEWQEKVRTRIRRSDGVIALISSSTPAADGQLWEISCAAEEGKPLRGIWIGKNYRTKPPQMGSATCVDWTWENVTAFIDSL